MTTLKWRNEPPDVPGWWWRRDVDGGWPSVEVVEVFLYQPQFIPKRTPAHIRRFTYLKPYLSFRSVSIDSFATSLPNVQWAGPLPEPEE